jgi:hypothetical protein
MMNASEVSARNQVFCDERALVSVRVRAALSAIVFSPSLRNSESRVLAVVWNLIANNGNWRDVLNNGVYWIVKPEVRLATIPMAICDSLVEGSACHANLRELCLGLSGDRVDNRNLIVFNYLTALLVGYTIHRQYEPSDQRYTRDWLFETTVRFIPEADADICKNELAKFQPFLEKPGELVHLKCPIEETIINALVSIHEKGTPSFWSDGQNEDRSGHAFDSLLSTCNLRRFVKKG